MLWQDTFTVSYTTPFCSQPTEMLPPLSDIAVVHSTKTSIDTELNLPVKELLNALEFLNTPGHNPGFPPI